MAICPSCQAQIKIGSEFFGGLFTCPECLAIYFIGFDGSPESRQQQESQPFSESIILPDDSNLPETAFETQPDPQIDSVPYSNPIQDYVARDQLEETSSSPIFSPLQDVIDFAHNEESTSLASFNVQIRGLDVNENLQALKDILSDSKLQLNFDQLKKKIKNGILKLEKLSPAQAAVLSFRLRPLPIEMKWEQSLL